MEISSFVKNTWKLLSMKMRIATHWREFSRQCFLQKLSDFCEDHAEADKYLFKRVAVNMQGTVLTLARLKIVSSYHQQLVK